MSGYDNEIYKAYLISAGYKPDSFERYECIECGAKWSWKICHECQSRRADQQRAEHKGELYEASEAELRDIRSRAALGECTSKDVFKLLGHITLMELRGDIIRDQLSEHERIVEEMREVAS